MSRNLRIILNATLVLTIFMTLTAATLERGHLLMPSNELDALLGLPKSGV